MVNRAELTDEEWQTFYGLLLLNERIYVGSEEKCKRFLNAVLWILRSGTQWRLLPATRAHACAAGATGSNAEAEALGRSKGGFTTKIHAITDALGNPLDFILTGGQSSDVGQADALLQLTPAGAEGLRQRYVRLCHQGAGYASSYSASQKPNCAA